MRLTIGQSEARRLTERLALWKAVPPRFVRDVFGATPDPWQDEVLQAFPSSKRIAIVSCASSGKTALESWLCWNFLLTREESQIGATAISAANLKANLWKEMAYWYGRSLLLQEFFEVRSRDIVARGFEKTWFMEARNWDRDANVEQQGKVLAGLHAKRVMFVLDEGGGIPSAVAATAGNVFADAECEEAHVVLAGNPLESAGPLYEAAIERPDVWKVFEITGDPDRKDRAPRVSIEWAREEIEHAGRDDYYVQVYVLGKFPTAATDALISLDEFNAAFDRWEKRNQLADTPRTLGVDVARGGKHKTVVTLRAGDWIWKPEIGDQPTRWQGQDTYLSSHRVCEIASLWAGKNVEPKRMPIFIDDIGVGGGVTDQVRHLGYNAIGVIVEAAALDKKRHSNLKSEICLGIQQRFRMGNIALHPDLKKKTTLVAEGTSLKVGFSGGRRHVEGKDEYIRRTKKSPDDFDSFMNSFADSSIRPGGGTVKVGRVSVGGILAEEF